MPAAKPSIVGQRFGMLVCTGMGDIVQSKGKKRERMWLFDCDCGQKTQLSRWKVEMRKPQKSCGCLNSPISRKSQHHRGKKPVNVVNQRFGNLVALEQTEIREDNATVWRCRCDCGKFIFNHLNVVSIGQQCRNCIGQFLWRGVFLQQLWHDKFAS